MSDTKQQCPTCLEPVVNGNCPYFHTQPSAAGSGARECYQIAHDAAKAIIKAASDRQDARFCRLLDSWTPDFAKIIEMALAKYADHCTAPLREEVAKLQDRLKTREGCSMPIMRDCPTHGESKELTAERTRREAAERERDELLEAARKVVKFWNTNDGYFGDLAAALRGKGE